MKPPRPLLHLARLIDGVLFFPALIAVSWGELTGTEPNMVAVFNDKLLHFVAYFGLAAMTAAAIKNRLPVVWACIGLMLLGGILEIIQGLTGRDMSAYDELANVLGVVCGGIAARTVVEFLRKRWAS